MSRWRHLGATGLKWDENDDDDNDGDVNLVRHG